MKARSYGLTDPGCVRTSNDDYFLVDESLGLFIVCDGVSGNNSGGLAAETCCKAIRDALVKNLSTIQKLREDPVKPKRDKLVELLEGAVQAANGKILELAEADSRHRGMCTTLEVLLLAGDHAILGHVGDSRIYLSRENRIYLLTEDHKVGAEMIKHGVWTKEEAARSSYANTLTRAVGVHPYVQVDSLQVELVSGDLFYLCSDGLADYLGSSASELREVAGKTEFSKLPQELVKFAKDRGGKDNVTAVVVRMEESGAPAAALDVLKKSEILGKVPLFRYLSYSELMQVLELVKLRNFDSGAVIIQEGTVGDEMYILVSGSVEITKAGQSLAKRGRGDVVGDMGLFDNAPRSASVVASSGCSAMVIARKDLLNLMRRDGQIAVKFLWAMNQELSKRLRATNQELADVKASIEANRVELPFQLPPQQ